MRKVMKKPFIKRVPNLLTVLRLLMIPLFVYAFYRPHWVLPERYFAMVIFMVANATDLLDGYIARKYDAISNFGRLADPVADKLMTISALVCFVESGTISWVFVALVVGKEALMVIGGYVMLRFHVVVYSKICGKLAQLCMGIAVVLTFIPGIQPWNTYVLYLGLALTFYALLRYTQLALRQLKELKEHPDNPEDVYAKVD